MATYTLKQCADLILADYLAWYEQGKKTGKWLQEGIINLEGVAGIGKTEGLYQVSDILRRAGDPAKGIAGYDIPAALITELFVSSAMDPESVAGTPAPAVDTLPDGSTIHVLKMHYREELVRALAAGDGGIMFLDEIGREPRHMRPLLLKLLSPQKTLAGLDVSKMYIVLAGNPADEEHNVDSIYDDAAVASRIVRVQVTASVDEWANYMYERSATHREVANFILENPKSLIGRDSVGDSKVFLSPRSWTIAASKLHIHGGGDKENFGKIDNPMASMVVNGIIGAQATAMLKNFMTKDRPMSVKDILQGKFIPDKDGRITSVAPSVQKSLQYHIKTKPLQDTEIDNFVKFLDCVSADYAAQVTRDSKQIHPQNMVKFAAKGIFNKFIDRVHRRVKTV